MTRLNSNKQNHIPMTTHMSNSKPKVEFQYGGRSIFETGSSFMSAVVVISYENLVCTEIFVFLNECN